MTWDFAPVADLLGPIAGLLAAVLVIGLVIGVGWFIAEGMRNNG